MTFQDAENVEQPLRQDLFPITRTWSYFNHAAIGPLPKPVIEAAQEYLIANSTLGEKHWEQTAILMENLRQFLAEDLGVTADEIAFTRNVSEGISFLASGLDWRPGDSVIVPEREFPANVYPWLNLEARGVTLRFLPLRNGVFDVSDLEKIVDETTRVVSLSSIQFFSGFRARIEPISAFCRSKGIILAADAIQHYGAFPIRPQELGLDYVAFGGHKWLMAGEGIGFVYCRRELAERLQPGEIGWQGVRQWTDFFDYRLDFQDGARRFSTGTVSAIGLYMLNAAIRFLVKTGWDQIGSRILSLTGHICRRSRELGFSPVLATTPTSGIVTVAIPGADVTQLVQFLQTKGFQMSARQGCLRFSPHFYNTLEEIDACFQALQARPSA